MKTPAVNERFLASEGDARRQLCADLEIHRPPEQQNIDCKFPFINRNE